MITRLLGGSVQALMGGVAALGLLAGCSRPPAPVSVPGASSPLRAQASPGVLIGAIRWDAWKEGNSTANWGVNPSLLTKYSYRQPFYGWYTIGVSNHQTILDQEIQYAADNHLDYWAFDWYPDEATSGNAEGLIQGPFHDYLASSKKSLVKFTVLLQSDWARYNNAFGTYVPRFVNYFQDPQYVRLAGNRPLVYLFEAGMTPFSDAELNQLSSAATAAGLGTPVYINVDHNTRLGRDGVSSYGPNGANPGGGKHCWQVQADVDTSNLGPYGGQLTLPGLTPMADPRPRSYGFQVDVPTYGQWEAHLKAMADWTASHPANTTSPAALLIYAWNEIDEGGAGIVPTVQHGTTFLEAVKAVKTGVYPAQYTDILNGDNCAIVYSGDWINYSPDAGVQGNYNNDEQIASSGGSAAQLSWPNATGFEVRGTVGPNRGRMDVYLDGALQGTYDAYSAGWAQNQTLFTVSGLAAGSHTLKVLVRGDHTPASSGTQIGIDAIRVHVSRSAGGGGGIVNGSSHQLVNVNSGKCLQLAGNSTDNGATATQWQCDQGVSKLWTLTDQGGGQYQVVNVNSGKCLQLAGNGTANDTTVVQWQCDQGESKLWTLSDQGGGQYRIINLSSGTCLQLSGNSTANGTRTVIWQCDQGESKLWTLP